MSRRHISQNEAHALAKRVQLLESERFAQRRAWARDYPGGVHLGSLSRERDWFSGSLEAAQKLSHAIVATVDEHGKINFYALPLPK